MFLVKSPNVAAQADAAKLIYSVNLLISKNIFLQLDISSLQGVSALI